MAKFKVGDRVEIAILFRPYLRTGTVARVIPNDDGYDQFTEYEVNFGEGPIENFYEAQLRLAKSPKDSH